MRIGTRLILSLAVPLILMIAAFGLVDEASNRARARAELEREGRAIARAVQIAAQYALRDRQPEDVRALIDKVAGYERVLGLRLFDARGEISYQSADLKGLPKPSTAALREVLTGPAIIQEHLDTHGEPVAAFLVPLRGPSGSLFGAVQVFQLESFVGEVSRARRASIVFFTASMVLAVVIILLLATRMCVSKPIEELVASLRHVGSGELRARRVPAGLPGELGRLAGEFNSMCDRLESAQASLQREQNERRRVESRLREAERLASIGQLAAGLAHEIGTPLNVISGRTDSLLRGRVGGEHGVKHLRVISSQIDRIARIVRGMLDFAKARVPILAPTDLPTVLESVNEFLEDRFQRSGVTLQVAIPSALPSILADADLLQEVFLNIALNAADSMSTGGTMRITAESVLRCRAEDPGELRPYVAVTFEDSGCGIQPEHLDRVFDPFFTTKDVGEGTGLGLSVSYGIVQEHGGWIDIESERGRGTRVTVFLAHDPAAGGRRPAELGAA